DIAITPNPLLQTSSGAKVYENFTECLCLSKNITCLTIDSPEPPTRCVSSIFKLMVKLHLKSLDVFHPQRPSTVEKKLPRFLEAMGVDMLLLDAKVILFFEVMFIIVHQKLTGKITDLQRIYGITSPEQLSQTADSYTNHADGVLSCLDTTPCVTCCLVYIRAIFLLCILVINIQFIS
ncbi:unnamed protein product, partial [Brassica oleracea var. botrytis]